MTKLVLFPFVVFCLTASNGYAASQLESLYGDFEGYDLDALQSNQVLGCAASIRRKRNSLTFELKVEGKGEMNMGPIALTQLQQDLVRGDDLRQMEDPHGDSYLYSLSATKIQPDSTTKEIRIGWRAGRF